MTVATHTLVLALAPFSEAALLVGPLAARRSVFPEESITLASSPGVCEVVRALGLANQVVPVPTLANVSKAPAGVFGNLSLLSRVRGAKFDTVVDLFPGIPSGLAALVAAGNRGVSDPGVYAEALLASRKSSRRLADPLLRLSQLLGVGSSPDRLDVVPGAEADAWVEKALQSTGYRGGGPVLTVHFSGSWTLTQMVDVASELRSQFDAWVIALDTPGEGSEARHVAGALGGRVLGVGSPSGERFIAALVRSSLVLTDDPGVANLAALARVRTVLIRIVLDLHSPVHQDFAVCSGLTADAVRTDAVRDAASILLAKSRTSSLFSE